MTAQMQIGPARTRPRPRPGIVHLGLGAFFRAHGALYLQEAMAASGGDWGVIGVSLRSADVRDRLAPQDHAYTALELSEGAAHATVVECLTDVLVAPESPEDALDALASEQTRLVTLTITEKGYCRGGSGAALDLAHPDIVHDLASDLPRTAPGYLVRGLDRRRLAGRPPFTVLSLDNLPANGQLTRRVVLDFATALDAELADWIARECRFPCSMVDRIVPATTQAVIDDAADTLGYRDPALVIHEPFRQWVIEDDFVGGDRPRFEHVGVQMVTDVAPFEDMKLRMLNGAHSALAYLGLLAGHVTVADAMRDEAIAGFVTALWREEIAPSLTAPRGVDLDDYAQALAERFRNPAIHHRLDQIAMDGSQKLPQRILRPLFENLAAERPCHRLLSVVAAWVRFVESRSRPDMPDLQDPYAAELRNAVGSAADDAALIANLLGIRIVFGDFPVDRIAEDLHAQLDIHTAPKRPTGQELP